MQITTAASVCLGSLKCHVKRETAETDWKIRPRLTLVNIYFSAVQTPQIISGFVVSDCTQALVRKTETKANYLQSKVLVLVVHLQNVLTL